MTEQANLIVQLNLVRTLLDGSTTLSLKSQKAARAMVQRLGDACHFNAGWHMASPERELKGSASTAKLQADLAPLVDLLQSRAKPARGRGRPTKDQIAGPDALVTVSYLTDPAGQSLAGIIDSAIREKRYALDEKKTTAAHVKRIERIITKLKATQTPKTNDLLIFRPKKKPRQ